MSAATFIERSLPARDRDETPVCPDGDLDAFERSPLSEDIDARRLMRMTRHVADGQRLLLEALRLRAEGRHSDYRVAMHGCAANLTEAAPLARLLASPPRAKE